ncbi:hypothetical protein GOV09_02900 [Candidatus Woesearchaeota archaeon]|nr:hypothetical protein [Candidatus Woesearchaeota archaeon]
MVYVQVLDKDYRNGSLMGDEVNLKAEVRAMRRLRHQVIAFDDIARLTTGADVYFFNPALGESAKILAFIEQAREATPTAKFVIYGGQHPNGEHALFRDTEYDVRVMTERSLDEFIADFREITS